MSGDTSSLTRAEGKFPDGAAIIFGATGGVGAVVAREFASAGANVAIVWRSKERAARDLAADIERMGRRARAEPV